MRYLLILLLLLASPVWSAGPYFVSDATGNDGDDGLSEGNAFLTIGQALDVIAAGETINVKADGVYDTEHGALDAVGECQTPGTAGSVITVEGYTTTPGDGTFACVTLDADPIGDQYASVIDTDGVNGSFYVWRYFRMTGASSDGFDSDFGADNVNLEGCRFDTNLGWGVQGDDQYIIASCQSDGNTNGGFDLDVRASILNSRSFGNSGPGVTMQNGTAYNSLFYDNGANINIDFQATAFTIHAVYGCTIDGENLASIGIDFQPSANAGAIVCNTIIYDCSTGIQMQTTNVSPYSNFNLLNSNTANFSDRWVALGVNSVTAAPDFINEASDNYNLNVGSPAIDAGTNAWSQ